MVRIIPRFWSPLLPRTHIHTNTHTSTPTQKRQSSRRDIKQKKILSQSTKTRKLFTETSILLLFWSLQKHFACIQNHQKWGKPLETNTNWKVPQLRPEKKFKWRMQQLAYSAKTFRRHSLARFKMLVCLIFSLDGWASTCMKEITRSNLHYIAFVELEFTTPQACFWGFFDP